MKHPYSRFMAMFCYFLGHRWMAYDFDVKGSISSKTPPVITYTDKCLRCNKETTYVKGGMSK